MSPLERQRAADALLKPLVGALPLELYTLVVAERQWQIAAVPDQDALLDSAERFEHFPYGLLLWESAVGLALALARQAHVLAGQRVLELGAGVGLPGLVARTLGAEVWQTDHSRSTLLFAEANALRNGVEGVTRFAADWRTWEHSTRYDLLLGADIMYERDIYFHLARIFERNLMPGGRLLLSDPSRPQALEFVAYLEHAGWHLEMETEAITLPVSDGQEARPVEVALYTGRRGRS